MWFSGWWGISLGAMAAAQPTAQVPYQIHYRQFGSEPDYGAKPAGQGQLLVFGEMVQAVRSDGSRAELETAYRPDGSVEYRRRVLTLASGLRVRSDETRGVVTARRNPGLGKVLARQALDPAKSCAGSYDGGRTSQNMSVSRDRLFGYETYKIVIDMKTARSSLWRAPALGCADLRILFEKFDPHSGRVVAVGDKVATGIRTGEPDAELFKPPSGL